MSMLADRVDAVIGVDTHKHSHTAAAVTPTGGLVDHLTVPTDAAGAKRMLAFAHRHAPGRRVWAIEGTGSYGAGLTTYLLEQGEWVVEIDRPRRPARKNGAKSDALDAIRAAREALGREHLTQPRRRGSREALRVLLATRRGAIGARTRSVTALHALVVNAPEGSGPRSPHCARRRGGPSPARPRPRSWSRRSGPSSRWCDPGSSTSVVSGSSPRHASSTPGAMPGASIPRRPSRCSRVWLPSRPHQGRRCDIGSTDRVTAS